MRVFIERPIESVEDAEALPEGTVAIQSWGHGTTARTLTNGRWITPSGSALPHAEVIGFTALVPVEAVEECERPFVPRKHRGRLRYITRWVEA